MILRFCARCGKELTDAASREEGIGPICRHLDNDVLAQLIPAEIELARMAFECIDPVMIPAEASETFIAIGADLQQSDVKDWRKTVKRIEWLCSFFPHGTVREQLTDTIGALGYVTLRALWDGDTSTGDASIMFEGGRLYLMGSNNKGGRLALKKSCQGAKYHPHYSPKPAWSVPADQWEAFRTVVLTHWPKAIHGGLDASIESAKSYKVPSVESAPVGQSEAPKAGPASVVTFKVNEGTIEIRSPYSKSFVAALKSELPYKDRAWNPVGLFWSVKAEHMEQAKAIAEKAYGCPVTVL